jgi:trehalose utilization protein
LSKPFLFLEGTTGELRWWHGEVERLGIVEPSPPIAARIPEVVDDHIRGDIIVRGVRW